MIRSQITTIVLLVIALFAGVFYVISHEYLLTSYEEIEMGLMMENIGRVQGAVANYNDAMTIKLRDWTNWDDSYQFVQDRNQDFIDSTLSAETVVNLDINLFVYLNANNEVVYIGGSDLGTGKDFSPEGVTETILRDYADKIPTDVDDAVSGIISLPEGILFIEWLPILTNEGDGPVVGTMIFGRFLDVRLLRSFSDLALSTFEVYPYDSVALPEDVVGIKEQLTRDKKIAVPVSDAIIVGYTILSDIHENPIGIVRIDSQREIYLKGKEGTMIFVLILCASIILFGLVVLLVLEKLLLAPFARLNRDVDRISSTDLVPIRVDETRHDEVSELGKKINDMLTELSASRKKEREAQRLREAAVEDLEQNLEQSETMNRLMVGRELKMIELKKRIAELENEKS